MLIWNYQKEEKFIKKERKADYALAAAARRRNPVNTLIVMIVARFLGNITNK